MIHFYFDLLRKITKKRKNTNPILEKDRLIWSFVVFFIILSRIKM